MKGETAGHDEFLVCNGVLIISLPILDESSSSNDYLSFVSIDLVIVATSTASDFEVLLHS